MYDCCQFITKAVWYCKIHLCVYIYIWVYTFDIYIYTEKTKYLYYYNYVWEWTIHNVYEHTILIVCKHSIPKKCLSRKIKQKRNLRLFFQRGFSEMARSGEEEILFISCILSIQKSPAGRCIQYRWSKPPLC